MGLHPFTGICHHASINDKIQWGSRRMDGSDALPTVLRAIIPIWHCDAEAVCRRFDAGWTILRVDRPRRCQERCRAKEEGL